MVEPVNATVAIIRVTYIEYTVVLPRNDIGLISLLNYVEPIVPISVGMVDAFGDPIVPTNEPMEYRFVAEGTNKDSITISELKRTGVRAHRNGASCSYV